MSDLEAWTALLALGAFHGVNPGMGWLFAVALGMQERRRRAVFQALVPIALGHALSIAIVVAVVAAIQVAVPLAWVRWPVAAGLVAFGVYKLVRSRHPRWVGMRVTFRDLVTWSFLMASAHGAGLMLLPVLLGWSAGDGGHEMAGHMGHDAAAHDMGAHAEHAGAMAAVARGPLLALLAVGVHTLGYLAVMLIVAIVIYEWVGVAILRKAWVNLDLVWALALIVAGVATALV
jgi:hypothetical protein